MLFNAEWLLGLGITATCMSSSGLRATNLSNFDEV